jgi:hypothetical protein
VQEATLHDIFSFFTQLNTAIMSNYSLRLPGSRRILWLLLFQCLGFTLMAQVRISGRVTGSQAEGLPGITVQVQGTNFATSTDAAGAYSLLAPLRPGTYELQFTGIGFRAQTRSLQVSGNTTETVGHSTGRRCG